MDEIWKDIPEYVGYYQISNMGRVYSCERLEEFRGGKIGIRIRHGRIIAPKTHYKGYKFVSLNKFGNSKGLRLHRLVALSFIPNPENKPEVNHIDGIKSNNHVSNLEWVTSKENMTHAHSTGLVSRRGEKNSHCRITEEIAKEIIEYLFLGHSVRQTFDYFKVSRMTVNAIYQRISWKHLPRPSIV